jgi:hypothetical protein
LGRMRGPVKREMSQNDSAGLNPYEKKVELKSSPKGENFAT